MSPSSTQAAGRNAAMPFPKITTSQSATRVSSSAVSTPASAASPTFNAPNPISLLSACSSAIAPRPCASTSGPVSANSGTSDSASRPLSMTSKEWVIPPRPKPGRKPATDTPPTKRKAQNRAAQRAFRERRAARVGELEDQLDEQKEEHDREVQELARRIRNLEMERQILHSRCQLLEGQLDKERQTKEMPANTWGDISAPHGRNQSLSRALAQPRMMAALYDYEQANRAGGMGQTPLALPKPAAQLFSIPHIISRPEEDDAKADPGCGSCFVGACACANALNDSVMGCGNCTLGSRCKCLEESLQASGIAELKRRGSPSSMAPEKKKHRLDPNTAMEMDFTAVSASKKRTCTVSHLPAPFESSQVLPSVEIRESCGFCKEGTYCLCAESMAPSSLGPTISQQTHTPPPSEDDVGFGPTAVEVTSTGAIKLPGVRSLRNAPTQTQAAPKDKCGPRGPGTCAQCLSDPISGLFCRSLAANCEKNNASGGGSCGRDESGGRCKDGHGDPGYAPAPEPANNSPLGLSLSCTDAYKTLSSHRHFSEAADDIASWLPKLKAMQNNAASGWPPLIQGRLAPIEVEAASIMSVLKGFDVRFGRRE